MKFAIVKTKSNFRNLNGKRLKVVEEFQNFIACEFYSEGQILKADFGRSEIVKIWTPINLNKLISL
jgi:hypothetical protein